MRNFKSIIYSMLLITTFLGCSGKDGDPGPKGEPGQQGQPGPQGYPGTNGQDGEGFKKRGFVEGIVSGVRSDGIAFNEPFKYEYGFFPEGFKYQTSNKHTTFILERYADVDKHLGWIEMQLVAENLGESNQSLEILNTSIFYFSFLKEINPSSLFAFSTRGLFYDNTFRVPISESHNQIYGFKKRPDGNLFYKHAYEGGEQVFIIELANGGSVTYERVNKNVYNAAGFQYGRFIRLTNPDGTTTTSSPLYNGIVVSLGNHSTEDYRIRKLATTDNDLSESVPVPADTHEITNVEYNISTGRLAFDFIIEISSLGRLNSTLNPLKVEGRFDSMDSKVYKQISGKINP